MFGATLPKETRNGDRSFRKRVVSPTRCSLTSKVVSLTKRNERYTCIYLVLSTMIRKSPIHVYNSFFKPLIKLEKLGKLAWHVGETTRGRKDPKS